MGNFSIILFPSRCFSFSLLFLPYFLIHPFLSSFYPNVKENDSISLFSTCLFHSSRLPFHPLSIILFSYRKGKRLHLCTCLLRLSLSYSSTLFFPIPLAVFLLFLYSILTSLFIYPLLSFFSLNLKGNYSISLFSTLGSFLFLYFFLHFPLLFFVHASTPLFLPFSSTPVIPSLLT